MLRKSDGETDHEAGLMAGVSATVWSVSARVQCHTHMLNYLKVESTPSEIFVPVSNESTTYRSVLARECVEWQCAASGCVDAT